VAVVKTEKSFTREGLFEEHYERVLPEARLLNKNDVRRVNLEPGTTVAAVLAIAPAIQAYREDMVKNLKDFNIERFDQLEDYAKAFSVAHSRYLSSAAPSNTLKDAYEEGKRLRELLHSDIENLILRRYVNKEALRDYKGLVGYRNVGMELQSLALLLKDHWETLQGKCATYPSELEHALKLSQRLQRGAGERDVKPREVTEEAELRNRMFTLFIDAYNDARRAIQYLRWREGDAFKIAPNLYRNNRPRGKKKQASRENRVEGTNESVTASIRIPEGQF
jgi:hypothetical protein